MISVVFMACDLLCMLQEPLQRRPYTSVISIDDSKMGFVTKFTVLHVLVTTVKHLFFAASLHLNFAFLKCRKCAAF